MVLAVLEAHCGVRLSGHESISTSRAGFASQPAADWPLPPRSSRRWQMRRCRRCGLFRRSVPVGRRAAGGADRGAAQGGGRSSALPVRSYRTPGVARASRGAEARNRPRDSGNPGRGHCGARHAHYASRAPRRKRIATRPTPLVAERICADLSMQPPHRTIDLSTYPQRLSANGDSNNEDRVTAAVCSTLSQRALVG